MATKPTQTDPSAISITVNNKRVKTRLKPLITEDNGSFHNYSRNVTTTANTWTLNKTVYANRVNKIETSVLRDNRRNLDYLKKYCPKNRSFSLSKGRQELKERKQSVELRKNFNSTAYANVLRSTKKWTGCKDGDYTKKKITLDQCQILVPSYDKNNAGKYSERLSSPNSSQGPKEGFLKSPGTLTKHKSAKKNLTNENSKIWLNLVSDDTVMIKNQMQENPSNPESLPIQDKVVHDIGDIHEFYQTRVVKDYKKESKFLRSKLNIAHNTITTLTQKNKSLSNSLMFYRKHCRSNFGFLNSERVLCENCQEEIIPPEEKGKEGKDDQKFRYTEI
ncbi:unnamed protein product [Moneuplotes crassus]|uniref:Uncharacterized protein n=1 Tax=Euplotes crassus TaxID=5936 RepID=A0AAD2D8V9_EUPCR|nr:unnamed protein product [Moneuplotes crassus]